MSRVWLLAFVAVAVIVFALGCSNSPVAIVNNVRISETEFNKRMIAAVGRDVLKDMIDRELLRQAAEEAQIEVDQTEFDTEVERAKGSFPTEEKFVQFLSSRSMTVEDWEEEVRMALVARELTVQDIAITEEALKAFFEQYKDRYTLPVRVTFSEIVVDTKENADEVLAELKKDPAKFADLAAVYSLSPVTKSRGGKSPEDMPVDRIQIEEVRQAVVSLPIAEISAPIKVSLGGEEQWYILRVDDRKAERAGDFELDKEQITRDYKSVNATQLADILKAQAEKSNVVVVDPRFQDLNETYSSISPDIPGFGEGGVPVGDGDVIADPPAGE